MSRKLFTRTFLFCFDCLCLKVSFDNDAVCLTIVFFPLFFFSPSRLKTAKSRMEREEAAAKLQVEQQQQSATPQENNQDNNQNTIMNNISMVPNPLNNIPAQQQQQQPPRPPPSPRGMQDLQKSRPKKSSPPPLPTNKQKNNPAKIITPPPKKPTVMYKAVRGDKYINDHALELITLVCSQRNPNSAHHILDIPFGGQAENDEDEKKRLMRLQLRQRFASASSIGMTPIEFARKLLHLWGGKFIRVQSQQVKKKKKKRLTDEGNYLPTNVVTFSPSKRKRDGYEEDYDNHDVVENNIDPPRANEIETMDEPSSQIMKEAPISVPKQEESASTAKLSTEVMSEVSFSAKEPSEEGSDEGFNRRTVTL